MLFYYLTVENVLFNEYFVILKTQDAQSLDSGLTKTAGIPG